MVKPASQVDTTYEVSVRHSIVLPASGHICNYHLL